MIHFSYKQNGQGMVEYALILALIALVVLIVLIVGVVAMFLLWFRPRRGGVAREVGGQERVRGAVARRELGRLGLRVVGAVYDLRSGTVAQVA